MLMSLAMLYVNQKYDMYNMVTRQSRYKEIECIAWN